jgi:hypothetical protein
MVKSLKTFEIYVHKRNLVESLNNYIRIYIFKLS